jgi:hypothetical protein
MAPRNRKRLGEFLILLIYLVIEGYGLWSVSHFWALTAGIAGFVALLFLDGEFSGKQILSYASAALAGCLVIYFFAPPIPAEEPWRGWLQAATEPTPENGCDKPDAAFPGMPPIPADTPVIIIGQVGMRTAKPTGVIRAISIGNCSTLTLERQPDGIRVNAPIYDAAGTLLGDIKDNGYTIQKTPSLTVEHNGDLSALIVHDEKG